MRKTLCLLIVLALLASFPMTGCASARATGETEPDPAQETLTEPPELKVVCGEESWPVLSGGYSWDYDQGNGKRNAVIACGLHPLDCQDILTAFTPGEQTVRLAFAQAPDEISVRCWGDENWGNMDAQPETLSTSNGSLELKSGGYIYEVTAQWNSREDYNGTASYVFYAVTDHVHRLAQEPQTVADPISGYCGNTLTTVYLDGEPYSFLYDDSVALTDILINLDYDPEKVCECQAEFTVDTEFGAGYEVNLSSGYVRWEGGQADLTQEQVGIIREILDRLK